MNTFVASADGLLFNDVLIPDSRTEQWNRFFQLLGHKPVPLMVTNELPLNHYCEEMVDGGVIKLSQAQARTLLKHGDVANHVYSWRMLGSISAVAERKLTQGYLPVGLDVNSAAIIAYVPHNSADVIGFSLAYCTGE